MQQGTVQAQHCISWYRLQRGDRLRSQTALVSQAACRYPTWGILEAPNCSRVSTASFRQVAFPAWLAVRGQMAGMRLSTRCSPVNSARIPASPLVGLHATGTSAALCSPMARVGLSAAGPQFFWCSLCQPPCRPLRTAPEYSLPCVQRRRAAHLHRRRGGSSSRPSSRLRLAIHWT